MIKNILLFAVAFGIGVVVALAARTAWFHPHGGPAAAMEEPQAGPMVHNPATPAAEATAPEAHAGHDVAPPRTATPPATEPPVASAAKTPVNTICPICGMEVDPDIPMAVYQGKTIGFGCKSCPASFAKSPDRYGPFALKNEKAP